MRTCLVSLSLLLAAVLSGCGDSSLPGTDAASDSSPPAALWLLAETPQDAIPVAQAKRTAREGDRIVVRGRIGGRADPLSHDVAVFVMMDPAVLSCRESGDGCKKPWDYCCETPQTIASNIATVQLIGDTESPMPIDLGAHGFKPLDEVVVVGTVAPRPSAAVLVIRAEKIHRIRG